jgi:hypothetical protein
VPTRDRPSRPLRGYERDIESRPAAHASERSASSLSDEADRDELRQRYYGLLQELRVLLPGAQVLVAFMLAAPFAARFGSLDDVGRSVFGVALVTGALAIVAFAAPTAFHRFGLRTERTVRLEWAIALIRAGLLLLAASLTAGEFVVARFVFGAGWSVVVGAVVSLSVVATWFLLPALTTNADETGSADRPVGSPTR